MQQESTLPRQRVFFALFILVGLAALIPFFRQALRDIRIQTSYQEASCTILSFRMVPTTSVFRWSDASTTQRTATRPEFTFRYHAQGAERVAAGFDNFDGRLAKPEHYANLAAGTRTTCWFDPAQPDNAVLVRRVPWLFYSGMLIPGVFIAAGSLFLRRSLQQKPHFGTVSVKPGRHLRYQLQPTLSHQRLTGCVAATILIVALAAAGACFLPWQSRSTSLFGPAPTALAALGLVEAFLLRHFLRAWRAVKIPEPVVEIDEHPLSPGQHTSLRLEQSGPLTARSFKIHLVCEETGSRTKTPVRVTLLDAGSVELNVPSNTRQFHLNLLIPEKARASEQGLQHMRRWTIRVARQIEPNLTLLSDFAFRVEKSGETQTTRPPDQGGPNS